MSIAARAFGVSQHDVAFRHPQRLREIGTQGKDALAVSPQRVPPVLEQRDGARGRDRSVRDERTAVFGGELLCRARACARIALLADDFILGCHAE